MLNIIKTGLIKLYQKLPILIYDGLAIPTAWYLAYGLRYNLQPFPIALTLHDAYVALGVLFLAQSVTYYHCKVYRGVWEFASLNDLKRILKAVLIAVFLVIPCFYLTPFIQHIPRSILPLYALILASLWAGGRLLLRIQKDTRDFQVDAKTKRVLIVGAGYAGVNLVRELNKSSEYLPVGFVEDEVKKSSLDIHGVSVRGDFSDIPLLTKKLKVDLIFIALPQASSALMRRIVGFCETTNVPFRTLPTLAELADGRVEVNALRAVSLEDLLGRDEVNLDLDKINHTLQGKRVLVTGGGGSIGGELCRQILRFDPESLCVLDNSEYQLYLMDQELSALYPNRTITYALVSVVDKEGIKEVFNQFKPHIIFHAAAYKHVPILESRVRAAVLNNVMGTKIVAEASMEVDVQQFVLISTDKAVNPTSVMGATKRIAELYCQYLNQQGKTAFMTVRFGNVLGSTGSVVPLFHKQIQAGGPVTVTHPDIERYFMTIPEACQLILQAMVNGKGGEIFVMDMGEPIKVRYLAEQMIRLSGKEVDIAYTGLRAGEKLYEELFHLDESLKKTNHEKLFQAFCETTHWHEMIENVTLLLKACATHDEHEMIFLIETLVPAFQSTQHHPVIA